MTPAVAVAVVTHDSATQLDALACSLAGELREGDAAVIVDNASHDGTPERACALGLRVIETGASPCFAAACRIGAEATSAPLILLLTPTDVQ